MFRNNESISGDYISQSIGLNAAINEWQKDIEVLVSVKPHSVVFGFIHCSIDCLQLLANGSLKLNSFRYIDGADTTPPSARYHLLIPSADIYDWNYCNTHEFPILMYRMRKDSVARVKDVLGLSDDFTNENRYVMCALDRPLDAIKYTQFMSAMKANGTQITAIDEVEAITRYNSVINKQELPLKSTESVKTTGADSSQIQSQGLGSGSSLVTDITCLMSRLLSGKLTPKRVLFGAYECNPSVIEFTAFKDIKFYSVRQNNGSDERFETIVIRMADMESVLMCLDLNLV
jgi:hypothetical protein